MIEKIISYSCRPEIGTGSTAKFWDEEHISVCMLEAHLNPNMESATRNHAFVEQSARWLATCLPPDSYPKLLDLGCGPGLYAEWFYTLGFKVTGIDLSERSITYAKNSAKTKGLPITYITDSYLDMKYEEAFDAATLIYCDYGALKREDRICLLRKIFRALRLGGKLVLDVFTKAHYANKTEHKTWTSSQNGFWSSNPHICLESFYRYDDENAYLDQYIVATDDRVECYNIWDHVFSIDTLKDELVSCGFVNFQFYEDVAGAELKSESQTLCVICEKGERDSSVK